MDDLAGKISDLLNDPGTLEQIMNLTSMLGGNDEEPNPLPPNQPTPNTAPAPNTTPTPDNGDNGNFDLSALLSSDMMQNVMSALGGSSNTSAPPPVQQEDNGADASSLFSGDMVQTMMRMAPLLGGMKKDDDTSRLLFALRPFLSEERKKKLDNASKVLQLIKILPVIKELNIF